MTNSVTARAPYQGVLQIFDYNRPFYFRSVAAVAVSMIVSVWLPPMFRALLLLGVGVAVFWLCASLLVSHYIYDLSNLYSLSWLPGFLSEPPARWINIHNGLDETSLALASLFPESEGEIHDIFDAGEMTEPSIKRARLLVDAPSATADWRELPAPSGRFEAAFLIFTAHELRQEDAHTVVSRNSPRPARRRRIGGLVEHARDWVNFLAFGPGFLHFFSERAWQRAANAAGMSIRLKRRLTPFVRVCLCGRQP